MGSFWKACFFVLILVVVVESDRKRREDAPEEKKEEGAEGEHPPEAEAAAEGEAEAPSGGAVAAPPKVESTTPMDWIELGIKKHNEYRAMHGVLPLVFNKSLCEISQAYANHIAKTFKVEHNPALQAAKLGENLYFSSSSDPIDLSADKPVTAWYDEIHDYDFKTGYAVNDKEILHFTQLVWKGTTDVGISYSNAVKPDGSHAAYVVANYYPRGNFDDFEENVLPPAVNENDKAVISISAVHEDKKEDKEEAKEDKEEAKEEKPKEKEKEDPTSGVFSYLNNGATLSLMVATILTVIISYYY